MHVYLMDACSVLRFVNARRLSHPIQSAHDTHEKTVTDGTFRFTAEDEVGQEETKKEKIPSRKPNRPHHTSHNNPLPPHNQPPPQNTPDRFLGTAVDCLNQCYPPGRRARVCVFLTGAPWGPGDERESFCFGLVIGVVGGWEDFGRQCSRRGRTGRRSFPPAMLVHPSIRPLVFFAHHNVNRAGGGRGRDAPHGCPPPPGTVGKRTPPVGWLVGWFGWHGGVGRPVDTCIQQQQYMLLNANPAGGATGRACRGGRGTGAWPSTSSAWGSLVRG